MGFFPSMIYLVIVVWKQTHINNKWVLIKYKWATEVATERPRLFLALTLNHWLHSLWTVWYWTCSDWLKVWAKILELILLLFFPCWFLTQVNIILSTLRMIVLAFNICFGKDLQCSPEQHCVDKQHPSTFHCHYCLRVLLSYIGPPFNQTSRFYNLIFLKVAFLVLYGCSHCYLLFYLQQLFCLRSCLLLAFWMLSIVEIFLETGEGAEGSKQMNISVFIPDNREALNVLLQMSIIFNQIISE